MKPATPIIMAEIEQRSDAWHRARAGVLTGSEFKNVLTPTGKPSKGRAYFVQLLAEWATGGPIDHYESPDMERGRIVEVEARRWYEMQADEDAVQVGLVYRDESRMAACSPDGLVGANGALEIKCPAIKAHIEYLLEGTLPLEFRPQVQGHLYVTGRDWCDFVSYYPGQPPLLVRVERDEEYIEALDVAVTQFIARLLESRKRLLSIGVTPSTTPPPALRRIPADPLPDVLEPSLDDVVKLADAATNIDDLATAESLIGDLPSDDRCQALNTIEGVRERLSKESGE